MVFESISRLTDPWLHPDAGLAPSWVTLMGLTSCLATTAIASDLLLQPVHGLSLDCPDPSAEAGCLLLQTGHFYRAQPYAKEGPSMLTLGKVGMLLP